jgi:hypothetical protein
MRNEGSRRRPSLFQFNAKNLGKDQSFSRSMNIHSPIMNSIMPPGAHSANFGNHNAALG